MKKVLIAIVATVFTAIGAFAQQPYMRGNTARAINVNTPASQNLPLRRIQPLQAEQATLPPSTGQPVLLYPQAQNLYPVYVYSQKSYLPQDNEGVINDGHAQNMTRNINYMNTSQPLPPSTGGIQR